MESKCSLIVYNMGNLPSGALYNNSPFVYTKLTQARRHDQSSVTETKNPQGRGQTVKQPLLFVIFCLLLST